MTEQPFDPADEPVAPDATAVVLKQILAQGRVIAEAEVEKVRRVIDWVVVNEVDPATHEPGPLCDRALRTAGEGSPYVSEFSIMEFSAVLGMSTDGGRAYLCGVAELRYRLPHLWEQVEAGGLPVWRALEIAKDTWTLPEDGAIFVDRHLADAAVSCSWAQIARLVAEATARFDPEQRGGAAEAAGRLPALRHRPQRGRGGWDRPRRRHVGPGRRPGSGSRHRLGGRPARRAGL